MSNTTEKDLFTDVVRLSNMPTNQAEMTAAWRKLAIEKKVLFNNDSNYSPFWRLITALVTKPVLWLINILVDQVLPNLFLKTAQGRWIDIYSWSVDVKRKPATKAKGELVFQRYGDTSELDIPSGTLIQTNPINGAVYRLVSTEAVRFERDEIEIKVKVQAEKTGTSFNLSRGYYSMLVDSNLSGHIKNIESSSWLLVPGSDEESDDDLKSRTRNQFTATNGWHIDASYKAMIASFPGVSIDDIYIEHDAPRGPGTANAFILFDANAPSGQYLTQINTFISNENHGFGDDLQCFAMTTYRIDIILTFWLITNVDSQKRAEIKQGIKDFVNTAFRELSNDNYSPTRVKPHSKFSWSRLLKELHQEFAEIDSLDFSNDKDLVNKLSIPEINILEVIEGD